MICAITGELRRVEMDRAEVACGDVVYEVLLCAADVKELRGSTGRSITLHTILDLEGDATRGGLSPRLIGFLRVQDKRFFQLFITVKGIGPKRALRALVKPTGQIAAAIEAKDTRFLVGLPEVGKRTAEQIVAELAGKAGAFAGDSAGGAGGVMRRVSAGSAAESDAIDGAVLLGLPRMDAERLLDRARATDPAAKSSEALLREMLRLRGGRE